MPKKGIFNSKVASHILCPSFVCKLLHECEDITKNAWRTPLNAQCNIEYRLPNLYFLYFFKLQSKSIIFYFLVNYRNRLFLYFFGYQFPSLLVQQKLHNNGPLITSNILHFFPLMKNTLIFQVRHRTGVLRRAKFHKTKCYIN